MIGYAITGSFCTHGDALTALCSLKQSGLDIQTIVSETAASTDTRFGKAEDLLVQLKEITGRKPILTIDEAEPLGPKTPLEALIIAPCTGNTLAKLAHGITDTSVCMAAKAHLRQGRPLLIALATNDALSANLANVASLLQKKYIYFVPLRQDDPENKPYSLVADFKLLPKTLEAALEGRQYQRLFQS